VRRHLLLLARWALALNSEFEKHASSQCACLEPLRFVYGSCAEAFVSVDMGREFKQEQAPARVPKPFHRDHSNERTGTDEGTAVSYESITATRMYTRTYLRELLFLHGPPNREE